MGMSDGFAELVRPDGSIGFGEVRRSQRREMELPLIVPEANFKHLIGNQR
jgi:hypothetical protein